MVRIKNFRGVENLVFRQFKGYKVLILLRLPSLYNLKPTVLRLTVLVKQNMILAG